MSKRTSLGKRRKARRGKAHLDHKEREAEGKMLMAHYKDALYQFRAMKRPKGLDMSSFDDLLKFHYADGVLEQLWK